MSWLRFFLLALLVIRPSVADAGGPSDPPEAALPVTGTVLDAAGRPIAGAQVELGVISPGYEAGVRVLDGAAAPAPAARAETDGKGRFILSAPENGLYRLSVRAEGKVPMEWEPLVLVEPAELEPVKLAADAGLVIRAVDEAGRGLPRLWIFATTEKQTPGGWRTAARKIHTGSDGAARLPWSQGESLAVSVFASGFAEIARTGVQSGLTVTLGPAERGREALLRVVDEEGRPVPGALLRVGQQAWPVARTDAGGAARFRVADGAPALLRVTTADGRGETRKLSAESATAEIRLPGEPRFLAGRIVEAGSQSPLGGALLWSPVDPGSFARTGLDGSCRLLAPDARAFAIRAAAAGHLAEGVRASEPEIRTRRLPALALRPAVSLGGVVLGPDGAPLGDVFVEAVTAGDTRRDAVVVDRRISSAEGKFELRRLAAGTLYEVRATRPGFLPASAEASTPAASRALPPIRLVLARSRPARGLVVDGRKRPLAGARVVLRRAADAGSRDLKPFRLPAAGERGIVEATTDAQGRFVIAEVPAGEIDLFASQPGYTPAVQRRRQLPAGGGSWDLGTLVLQPGAVLSGRVVDPAGRPLAGARVHRISQVAGPEQLERALRDQAPEAQTGTDGRFTLADLPAGKPVHLFVTAADHLPAAVQGLRPPMAAPVTVRLEAGARLAGRVLDESGEPVAGAEVEWEWRAELEDVPVGQAVYRRSTTDREGRFDIRDAPRGTVLLAASARGFIPRPPAPVTAPLPEGTELEIRLERGAVLEGHVKTGEGRPVSGVRIIAGDAAGLSDGEGAYRVEGVRPGPVQIDLFHPSYRRQRRTFRIEPGVNALDFELEAGRRIAGRVMDERSQPVSNAEIVLQTPGQGRDYRVYRARSTLDGRFEIASVARGKYQIDAEATGFAPVRRRDLFLVAGQDVENLDIVLDHAGAVVGRILGLDPEQLARVVVEADDDQDLDLSRAGRVDAAGRFEVRDLAPGVWELHARLASEQREVTGRVTVAAGETAERDLEFSSHLTLSGRVEYDGEPLPDALVSVRASHRTLERSVVTGYDGGFRLDDLEPDTYWLGVSHSRELLTHNENLELSADRDVVIRLEAGALEGRIADKTTQQPVGAATVQLLPTEGAEFTVTGSSDPSGRFRLPRIPPGRFRLRVTADGYSPAEETVDVSAGPAGPAVEVALEPAPGLELRARLASGSVPAFVSLRAETPAGALALSEQRPVDKDGKVRVSKLPAGTWNLILGATGGGLVRLTATVPGPPVEVTFPDAAPLHVQVPAIAESSLVGSVVLAAPGGQLLETLTPYGKVETRETLIGGRATIDAVPAGAWNVQVETPDGRRWSAVAVTDGRQESVVQLE